MLAAKNKTLVDRLQKSRNIQRQTARVYASNLRRVNRELSDRDFNFDLKWLKDTKILDKLKQLKSINVKRNLTSSIIVGLAVLPESETVKKSYSDYLHVLNKENEEMLRKGKFTKKQEQKHVPWKQIKKLTKQLNSETRLSQLYKRDKFVKKDFVKLQQALILRLYTGPLPPVRSDWADIRFYTEKEYNKLPKSAKTGNVLISKRGSLEVHWKEYKTKRVYGDQVNKVPKGVLYKQLMKHMKYMRRHFPENRNLLLNHRLEPMSRNSLSKFLGRLFTERFGKKVGSSAIRTSFLTHRYDHKTMLKEADLAKKMHHSQAARKYYVKETK